MAAEQRTSWWRLAVLAAAVLALVVLRYQPRARAAIADFFAPFLERTQDVTWRAEHASLFNQSKIELIEEIERLRGALAEQRLANAENGVLAQENLDLRSALGVPARADYVPVLARVLGRDPASGGRRLRLDRGTLHGLAVGQAVLAHGALLGRVLEVSPHSAVAQTLADPDCRVSVRLVGANAHGVLFGRGGNDWRARPLGVVKFLPRDLDYAAGIEVVTSDYGLMVPLAIPVGVLTPDGAAPLVEDVNHLYRNATARLYAFEADWQLVSVLTPAAAAAAAAPAASAGPGPAAAPAP